ncbi:putative RNase H-like nuclease [Kribbella amoyensis]|uniref:Putative RNase H-like nuclease n=1 Tax=Kribbella amoyensis TaxID=996641 RepID=A0A561B2P2_9ACTN|nr:DUF429 domain-containing protein [Kribbella amoyensis]TWD73127.1 putative RNase H-like nuclease [Kribbella amoyensis]
MARVLGVDAAKTGWVGVLLDGESLRAWIAADLADLIAQAEAEQPLTVVAIDVPIGLPDEGSRRADELARKAVGMLAASIPTTPTRAAVTGGVVAEVDEWIRAAHPRIVVEVHPEVSFARLAGQPLTDESTTWAGADRRLTLLQDAGINLTGDLGLTGTEVTVETVLNATAAAWTALRVAYGMAFSLPDPPETFSDNHPSAIWV